MSSIMSLVADPQFSALSPSDQQAAVSSFDPDFAKLSPEDFSSAVEGLQKEGLKNPAALAPPPMPKPPNPIVNDTSYMAVPSESTPEGYSAAVAQRAQEHPVENEAGNEAIGAAKLVGRQVNEVNSWLPNSPTGAQPKPVFSDVENSNGAQTRGDWIGQVAEWMLLQEAAGTGATALQGSEYFAQMAKTVKFLEANPKTAIILKQTMANALATAAQSKLQGATNAQALESAGTSAAVGLPFAGISAASQMTKFAQDAANDLSKNAGDKDAVSQTWKYVLNSAQKGFDANQQNAQQILMSKLPQAVSDELQAAHPDATADELAEMAVDYLRHTDPEAAKNYVDSVVRKHVLDTALSNPLLKQMQSGKLDDVTSEMLSGKNTRANLDDLYTILGKDSELVPQTVFIDWFKDAAKKDGSVNLAKLTDKFSSTAPETMSKLLAPLSDADKASYETIMNGMRSARNMQTLVRAGIIGAGAVSGLAGVRNAWNKGAMITTVGEEMLMGGMIAAGGGVRAVKPMTDLIDRMAASPALWNTLRGGSVAAQVGVGQAAQHFVYDPDKGLTPAEQPEQPAQK